MLTQTVSPFPKSVISVIADSIDTLLAQTCVPMKDALVNHAVFVGYESVLWDTERQGFEPW